MMKKKTARLLAIILAMIPLVSIPDVMLGPGETYVYSFTSLPEVVWASPSLPAYDDYSFTLALSGDLYNNPPDNIRIRLFEEPGDASPVHNIFGESVPSLSVSPSQIMIAQVSGTMWYDRDGRVEVEVLAGSINIHHLSIELGEGQLSFSSYIEAIPEPGSVALMLVGSGLLCGYRRHRSKRNEKAIRIGGPTCLETVFEETF